MPKPRKDMNMSINGKEITVIKVNGQDYISLTDMAKNIGDETNLYNWLRNRNTVEFLGIWESLHNPNFKPIEFDRFKKEAGLNNFTLSPSKWTNSTHAIGIISKAGRYGGGTFAHKDIAFEFGTWLNPEFKLYLIKEFQRLKEEEAQIEGWNYRRFLSKVNYRVHTDSVRDNRIAVEKPTKEFFIYAEEADILNVALWGCTAAEWKQRNPDVKKNDNMREYASIAELTVLSNLESLNSTLLRQGIDKARRFEMLQSEAQAQLNTLLEMEKRTRLEPGNVDPA